MNGSNTLYSSSSLLKNAQTWRASPSCEPAKQMGNGAFFILYSSRLYSHPLLTGISSRAARLRMHRSVKISILLQFFTGEPIRCAEPGSVLNFV